MPGVPGATVVTTLVCYLHTAHEAAGATGTRHSPRPRFSGRKFHADSGASRRGSERVSEWARRHCEERKRRAIHSSFASLWIASLWIASLTLAMTASKRLGCLKNRIGRRHPPRHSQGNRYGIFYDLRTQSVVPANAGTHTARTLNSALEQRPFFTFEARGDGSLRSQGRPAESLCEATTASTRGSIPPYAIALPVIAGQPAGLNPKSRAYTSLSPSR